MLNVKAERYNKCKSLLVECWAHKDGSIVCCYYYLLMVKDTTQEEPNEEVHRAWYVGDGMGPPCPPSSNPKAIHTFAWGFY